jgi:formate hydrogenlyase subunit 3/multisubunit Na+/H+ antiporter MnhD subunit
MSMLIVIGVAALLVAGLGGALAARWTWASPAVYAIALAACALEMVVAAVFLLGGGAAPTLVLPIGLPWLQAHFRLDELSAFFLLVVGLIGGSASLFGIGYGRHESEPARVLPFFPLFLAGMMLVLLADDAFVFLVAWEFMSLASWFLVLASHREDETRHAAYVYLVMAGIGGACLLLACGLLAGVDGGYGFAQMRGAALEPPRLALVVVLVLLGAGSKAGLVPLHAWLPLAHPAAPSHVSALMSGVMTKVAIYALVRFLFDLLDPLAWWWGAIILALGAASAVLGVLYALMEHDLKKLLAYHTVENIGIIVCGLGLALVFRANGLTSLAALALIAALLHVLNHALFKSLLFCGAGAVLAATGERLMERLGGLVRGMPATALTFLIGAAAISALPPLNGFVSEWLIFQAILQSPSLPQWPLKFGVPIAGALLALAAALAAACFVKAFGITFLGRPRTAAAADAKEVEFSMRAAMAFLAALCALIGILPVAALQLLGPATVKLLGAPLPLDTTLPSWLFLVPLPIGRSSYSGLIVFLVIALLATATVLLIHRLASDKIRRGPAWDCGFPDARPQTQYGPSSFAQPLRRVFGASVFRARERVDMPAPGDLRAARLTIELRDFAWEWLYQSVADVVAWSTVKLNRLQFLTIRRYLTLMFLALLVLLTIVAVSQ